jgi:hypothetical protein
MWITGRGVLITLYDNMSPPYPFGMGYRPPLLPSYPPTIIGIGSKGGIIPYITLKIIFGKNCSLFPLPFNPGRGSNSYGVNKISFNEFFKTKTPISKMALYGEKKFFQFSP